MLSVATDRAQPAAHYTDLVSAKSRPDGPPPTAREFEDLRGRQRRIKEIEHLLEDERTEFYAGIKDVLGRLPAVGGRGIVAEELLEPGEDRQKKKSWVRWVDQLDLHSRRRRLAAERGDTDPQ